MPAEPVAYTASQANTALTKAAQQLNSGETAILKVRNAYYFPLSTMRSVAAQGDRLSVAPMLYGDTVEGNRVLLRVYVDPSRATRDIYPGGTISDQKVENLFEKYFSNRLLVLKLDQEESYGMRLRIAAKVDLTGFDTNRLYFYSYNPRTNTYVQIVDPSYSIDRNGYLHFYTTRADYVVVTSAPLNHR